VVPCYLFPPATLVASEDISVVFSTPPTECHCEERSDEAISIYRAPVSPFHKGGLRGISVTSSSPNPSPLPEFPRLFRSVLWSPPVSTSVVGVFQIRAFITTKFPVNTFHDKAAILVFTDKGTDMLCGTANAVFFNQLGHFPIASLIKKGPQFFLTVSPFLGYHFKRPGNICHQGTRLLGGIRVKFYDFLLYLDSLAQGISVACIIR